MDEMLGNHYFLARNYARAAELLENALRADPKSKPIRRKIIICYAQTGKIEKALKVFLSLIKEDIDFVINTDPVDDDCPCPELVFQLENEHQENQASIDYQLVLGMLWLYCNLQKSNYYFEKAAEMIPDDTMVKSIRVLLSARLERKIKNTK
jgi:pentatricopeptide repeat protein